MKTPDLSRSVRGSVVLITGAASGMGRAAARLFASEGAKVAVTDRDAVGAARVAEEITQAGHAARAWALDVADAEAIERVVAEAAKAFGGLDIIINNAGVAQFLPLDDPEYDRHWARVLDILLTAPQRVVRAALPHLRRSAAGRVINVASTEALVAQNRDSIYCAGKSGVLGLTRAMAVELGRDGITVNCICPGPIHTGMTAAIPEDDKATFARRYTALRRYGQPEEVAHAMLSLALPASSYITGVVLPVDGGQTARAA
ncbi:MAG: SDR family oxidoreductase [Burkholderiales bacterium]|nr:SDR family oxidoreductase [Burkholderiales bacterium]